MLGSLKIFNLAVLPFMWAIIGNMKMGTYQGLRAYPRQWSVLQAALILGTHLILELRFPFRLFGKCLPSLGATLRSICTIDCGFCLPGLSHSKLTL